MATNNDDYQHFDSFQADYIEKWLLNNGYNNAGYIIGKTQGSENSWESLKNEIGASNYARLSQSMDQTNANAGFRVSDDYTGDKTGQTDSGSHDVLSYEEWSKLQDLGHGTVEDYGDYLKSQNIGVTELGTVYDTTTGKGFSSTVEELSPDTSNTGFETEVIEDVIKRLGTAADLLETPLTKAKTIAEEYDALNEDLRNKLSGEIGSGTELQFEIIRTINFMHSFTLDLRSDLQKILTQINSADDEHNPAGDGEPFTPPAVDPGGASESYHGSSSGGGSSSAGDVGVIPGTDNTPDVFIESAVVGTLTFSTIVPLFEELGKPSTIQSSLTGEYDVVGIFQHEGKYYYRIYDKNLKKFYFAEIDNNSKFITEYAEVLKMNEDAMMLSSPDIGQNVLTKMTDINEVYFVNGTLPGEGDSANITFANILDGMDGKNYYVPLSDSVEMVTLDVFKASILGDTTTPDTNTNVSNNVG